MFSARARGWPNGQAALGAGDQTARPARTSEARARNLRRWQFLPYQVLLVVWAVDLAAILVAGALARAATIGPAPWRGGEVMLVAAVALGWLLFNRQDVTRSGHAVSLRMRAGQLTRAWQASFGILLLALLADAKLCRVLPGVRLPLAWPQEGGFLLCLFVCGLAVLTIARLVAAGILVRFGGVDMDHAGHLRLRAVVLGSALDAARVVAELGRTENPPVRVLGALDERGMMSVGWVDAAPVPDGAALRAHAAAAQSLGEVLRRAAIDTVIIAPPRDDSACVGEMLRVLRAVPVDIWLAPDLGACGGQTIHPPDGELPFLRLRGRPLSIAQQATKKAEDVVVGIALLLLAAPAMLAIAAAIKLESSGPVLFKQQRRGYGERLITVLKFRTMYENLRDDHASQQTVRGDKRVTKVGRILRRLSLDELPQLINVMRGEMSVVGPRPHALQTKAEGMLFDAVVENYAERHRVKPGITGWAQVNGWRGETDTVEKIVKRVEFDLHYIANWSLRRDLAIICKTVLRMPADRKAY